MLCQTIVLYLILLSLSTQEVVLHQENLSRLPLMALFSVDNCRQFEVQGMGDKQYWSCCFPYGCGKTTELRKTGLLQGRNTNGVSCLRNPSIKIKTKGKFRNKIFPLNIQPQPKYLYLFVLKRINLSRSKKMCF